MRPDKFVVGAVLIIIGIFIDRILYFWIFLPKIGKAFSWHVSFNDLFRFYTLPFSWVGLFFIFIGVIFILYRIKGR